MEGEKQLGGPRPEDAAAQKQPVEIKEQRYELLDLNPEETLVLNFLRQHVGEKFEPCEISRQLGVPWSVYRVISQLYGKRKLIQGERGAGHRFVYFVTDPESSEPVESDPRPVQEAKLRFERILQRLFPPKEKKGRKDPAEKEPEPKKYTQQELELQVFNLDWESFLKKWLEIRVVFEIIKKPNEPARYILLGTKGDPLIDPNRKLPKSNILTLKRTPEQKSDFEAQRIEIVALIQSQLGKEFTSLMITEEIQKKFKIERERVRILLQAIVGDPKTGINFIRRLRTNYYFFNKIETGHE